MLKVMLLALLAWPATIGAEPAPAREDLYGVAQRTLQDARRTNTLRAAAAQLQKSGAPTPALQLFVRGYAALLSYERATADRELEQSFALVASPHVAAALALNAFEVGLPDRLLEWSTRGLDVGGDTDVGVAVELRLLRARALTWLTRFEEERAEILRALALARASGDDRTRARALRAHAGILDAAGQKREALDAVEEAIRLSESLGDTTAVGYHLLEMTNAYYPVHPFAEMIPLIDRALVIARQVRDRHLEGRFVALRGRACYILARYGEALQDLTAAEVIFRQTGGLRSRATTAGNLSLVFTQLGEYDHAEQQAWLATSLYRRIANPRGARESLDNLGRIALMRGHPATAVTRHRQVVSYTRKVGDLRYLPGALVRLGLAHLARAEWGPAERAIREAVSVSDDVGTADDRASALVALGDVLRSTGREAEADPAYRRALAMAPELANSAPLLVRAHHGEALLEIKAGRLDSALPHFRAAIDGIERVRSTAGRAELQLTYFADKTALYVDAIDALVDAHRSTARAEYLEEALAVAERAKARTLLDALSVDENDPPTRTSSIAEALAPGDLLIEFVAGARRSFVFSLRPNGDIRVDVLPARAVIEREVAALRELMSKRPSSVAALATVEQAGSRAYAALLGASLARAVDVTRLIIVGDGLLVYAPFEALTIAGTQTYVAERYEVVRAASGAVFTAIRARPSRTGHGFAGFGDPRLASGAHEPEAAVVRALERDGYTLAPLPGARREVEAAASIFSAGARLYTGQDFTAAAALTELQRPNRIVHFASHAILDERVPDRSGILVSASSGKEAAMLRARDLSGVTIAADLVVLSACQTGLGHVVDGEGVLGLSWAFTRAGATSLVVTLWNVSDAASTSLIVSFYRALAAGETKSAALKTARTAMARGSNPLLRHPYFWAGYALIGDPH